MYAQKKEWEDMLLVVFSRFWHGDTFSTMSMCYFMMKNNSTRGYQYSDIVIQPDMKRFRSSKLDGYEAMVEEGYNATISAMPEILKLINNKRYRIWKQNKRKTTY